MMPSAPDVPDTDFPAPPDVILHAALTASPGGGSAKGATLLIRSGAQSLRDAILPDNEDDDPDPENREYPLQAWGEDLRQAFLPFDLWSFAFRTVDRIGSADLAPQRPFDRVATAVALRQALRAMQREIFALSLEVPVGDVVKILLLSEPMIYFCGQLRELGGAAIAAFRLEAAAWLAGCEEFSFEVAFLWPSAHERLAIEKLYLSDAMTSPPQ